MIVSILLVRSKERAMLDSKTKAEEEKYIKMMKPKCGICGIKIPLRITYYYRFGNICITCSGRASMISQDYKHDEAKKIELLLKLEIRKKNVKDGLIGKK